MFSGDLAEMAVFAAVVNEGSFTAGAQRLGVTKQSVSERITRLEQRLGVQLLVRTTRALRLTEAGTRYHEACAAVVSLAEQADREARSAQQHATGLIRVTAPVGLAAPLLIPVAREFRRLHPGVRLELVFDESVVDLVRSGIDLAIRAGTVDSSATLIARRLFESVRVVVASPAYLAEHPRPADAKALAGLPCVTRRHNDTWVIDTERVEMESTLIVNTFEAAREVALAGIAIAQVPGPIVADDIRAGRLQALLRPTRGIAFTAVWPSKRLPVRVRLFQELLAQRATQLAESIDSLVR